MTAPNLSALALAAEEAAARGEKPVLEWKNSSNDPGFFHVSHGDEFRFVDASNRTINVNQLVLPGMHVTSANVGFSVNVAGIPFFELSFTSALAGQLFAESIVRLATAPLHREPEWREAAASFTRLTLKEWLDSEGGGGIDGLDLQEDFLRLGLLMQDPSKEEGDEWFVPTPAGAALLAATADTKREAAP